MIMIPQDREPMLVKARVLLSELGPVQREAVRRFGKEFDEGEVPQELESRLFELGLLERRTDGPALTELGEVVHALMADAA